MCNVCGNDDETLLGSVVIGTPCTVWNTVKRSALKLLLLKVCVCRSGYDDRANSRSLSVDWSTGLSHVSSKWLLF